MKEVDKQIIGDIFRYVKLEQDMPALTKKGELTNYRSPTLIIAGKDDIFFPANKLEIAAKEIIPNLVSFKMFEMGHFPSAEQIINLNEEIKDFLHRYY